MRRVLLCIPLVALAACHAHTTAAQRGQEQTQMEKPPDTKQVQSERPVRTTPGGMLDPQSMKQIQSKLTHKGFKTPESGQLDEETQAALRKFQAHEHIASTGLPDYGTLRRLGLDPHKIYLGGTERRDEAKHNEAKR
ncbi:MAG TPA: peptidoglycan-binding domain-containing protein [Polyangia bacterium]